nr:AAA family ATPase [Pantoea sp. CCBC3-3-1]
MVKKREKKNSSIEMEDFVYLFNAMRTHDFVEEYYKLKNTNETTYKPLSNFVEVLNSIFNGRKTFYISASNELVVESYNKREVTLEDLSSGEKQILIILGEALLQDEKDCIYIADEPELSLHVTWQENLVAAVTSINKNTQIIFATHSPDVVGFLDEYTIDMAEAIQ